MIPSNQYLFCGVLVCLYLYSLFLLRINKLFCKGLSRFL
ncbi:putative membrane protein [Synechococcus sp. MVIR-18-1]|nr:putative membrane protein [Synechococcus sp. MVIR-18-1]